MPAAWREPVPASRKFPVPTEENVVPATTAPFSVTVPSCSKETLSTTLIPDVLSVKAPSDDDEKPPDVVVVADPRVTAPPASRIMSPAVASRISSARLMPPAAFDAVIVTPPFVAVIVTVAALAVIAVADDEADVMATVVPVTLFASVTVPV